MMISSGVVGCVAKRLVRPLGQHALGNDSGRWFDAIIVRRTLRRARVVPHFL
jgi:hypothetical protein